MSKKISTKILMEAIKGSLIAGMLVLVLGGYGRDKSAVEELNTELKSMHQEVIQQNKKVSDLNKKVDKLETELKKVDKLEKSVKELDKQVKEKIAYREKLSEVIQKTSEKTEKPEADNLAKAIDDVTSEFSKKYGCPRNVPKMLAIISTESDFRNLDPNDAYAVGYAQVTPPCLEEVNKLAGWSYTMSDMYNAEKNLKVAWFIINRDIKKYNSEDMAIVAYNQGYRHLARSAKYCRTDKTSYLYKVNAKTEKYKELLKGGTKL